MFETILWFIFRDSRVKLKMIKSKPGITLLLWTVINLALFIYLVAKLDDFQEHSDNGIKILRGKLYIELISCVLLLPFLIYRGFKTVYLD